MWPFFRQKQKTDSGRQLPLVGLDLTGNTATETQHRKRMSFNEIVDGMGDFSDLAKHDVALKFWLPEAAEQALVEIGQCEGLSASEFMRQFLVVHCYGLYAFYLMTDARPKLFKENDRTIRFSLAEEEQPQRKKRIDTYWVPELGKNVAPVKVWVPARIKTDLQTLGEHVGLTVSNYVREILISRLLGHGMLPQRPEAFKAYPTPAAEDWCEGREVPWREVPAGKSRYYKIVDIRSEWVDDDEGTNGVSP